MLGLPVRDATSGYRVYRRELLARAGAPAVPLRRLRVPDRARDARLERSGSTSASRRSRSASASTATRRSPARIVVEALWLVTVWGIEGPAPRLPRVIEAIAHNEHYVTSTRNGSPLPEARRVLLPVRVSSLGQLSESAGARIALSGGTVCVRRSEASRGPGSTWARPTTRTTEARPWSRSSSAASTPRLRASRSPRAGNDAAPPSTTASPGSSDNSTRTPSDVPLLTEPDGPDHEAASVADDLRESAAQGDGLSAEESAVHVRDDAPGWTDHPDDYVRAGTGLTRRRSVGPRPTSAASGAGPPAPRRGGGRAW